MEVEPHLLLEVLSYRIRMLHLRLCLLMRNITRAGALFPFYRTSSLLEQLKGKVHVPSVLLYPGVLDGAAGLKFMGVLDAEHNYRPKIF